MKSKYTVIDGRLYRRVDLDDTTAPAQYVLERLMQEPPTPYDQRRAEQ